MVSRDDYERVIDSFLAELQATIAGLTVDKLPRNQIFHDGLQESLSALRDPTIPPEEAIGFAFTIVDEFVNILKSKIIDDSYVFYVDTNEGQVRQGKLL